MSVQVEKLEKNMAKLTIEVPVEEFEAAIEKAYQKEKGKLSIPGFRKGKAPRKMIEQMYGKEVFFDSAVNTLIPEAYEKAYDECEEDIVSSPEIEVVQVEAGKPVIFTATVALKPEVKLGKYKGVSVDKIDISISDEEVEDALKAEQKKQARTVEITDRAVENGDQTVIDFEGFVDGVAFEGGKGSDYPLTIGSGAFIPGFEEALIGAAIGVETDVNVTFPEDYQAEELAGKPAVFKCTVKSIKAQELPEIDDELASDAGFDNVAAWKDSLRADIEVKKISDAKSAKEDAAIDAVIADATMDIPEAMIKTEGRSMIEDFARQIQSQGMSFEQYMQFTGMTLERFEEQVKPQAEQRIKSRLVLEAVAEAEKLTATEEDFDAEVRTMAEAYQLEEDKVREMLGEAGRSNVEKDIVIKKALEFITDNAKETKPKKKAAEAEA